MRLPALARCGSLAVRPRTYIIITDRFTAARWAVAAIPLTI